MNIPEESEAWRNDLHPDEPPRSGWTVTCAEDLIIDGPIRLLLRHVLLTPNRKGFSALVEGPGILETYAVPGASQSIYQAALFLGTQMHRRIQAEQATLGAELVANVLTEHLDPLRDPDWRAVAPDEIQREGTYLYQREGWNHAHLVHVDPSPEHPTARYYTQTQEVPLEGLLARGSFFRLMRETFQETSTQEETPASNPWTPR